MFKENLSAIIDDLSGYHSDKEELLKKYTQERLEKSLRQYYKEVEKSLRYLQNRKEDSIIKNSRRIFNG